MKSSLLMDFSVNRKNKKINVKREFAAPVLKVWAAWTKSELLDQWWAPKPWRAETKKMDFKVGGFWLYAMVSPEGERHWGRVDYKTIAPLKSFSARDAFCNENGIIDQTLPRASWTNVFNESDNSTVVTIAVVYDELSDLEKVIEMGVKEGFTAALENLDTLIDTF